VSDSLLALFRLKRDGLFGEPFTPANWTPSIDLKVTFAGGHEISQGNVIARETSATEPAISFSGVIRSFL
jgi:hypothetical protein